MKPCADHNAHRRRPFGADFTTTQRIALVGLWLAVGSLLGLGVIWVIVAAHPL